MNKKSIKNIICNRGAKKGFTLIELLIVISIALILMSFMLPKFNGYMTKAKNLKAENEAQQIYTAAMASYGERGGEFDEKEITQDIEELVGDVSSLSAVPSNGILTVSFTLDNKQYSFVIDPKVNNYELSPSREITVEDNSES
ncbi:type IV pilus assembly protein PilA [Clostridium pascui]|uniref:type II secretion system protein n=1 Tax=Clostridium pascui TaxID=46609 RepID=UPI0019576D55|nr:type II secretion system protein [Clostridium pascui]MBM7869274.1 type IV pilus assembly protein PilA [Clostridium pascui]